MLLRPVLICTVRRAGKEGGTHREPCRSLHREDPRLGPAPYPSLVDPLSLSSCPCLLPSSWSGVPLDPTAVPWYCRFLAHLY